MCKVDHVLNTSQDHGVRTISVYLCNIPASIMKQRKIFMIANSMREAFDINKCVFSCYSYLLLCFVNTCI